MRSFVKKADGIYCVVSTAQMPRNSQYNYETMVFPAVKHEGEYNIHWGMEMACYRCDTKLGSWINHYKGIKAAKKVSKNFIDFL